VLANPLPADQQLDPDLHEQVLTAALADATAQGITGRDVTPFLLARFHHDTAGASLTANIALVLANARLAAEVAAADAAAA
jgi:pseudouridine-5'-phosphate glycosidase